MEIITIYHVHQGEYYLIKQIITINCDYATKYALFKALIDSHNNFDIKIKEGRI